jgi:hypothetical protein
LTVEPAARGLGDAIEQTRLHGLSVERLAVLEGDAVAKEEPPRVRLPELPALGQERLDVVLGPQDGEGLEDVEPGAEVGAGAGDDELVVDRADGELLARSAARVRPLGLVPACALAPASTPARGDEQRCDEHDRAEPVPLPHVSLLRPAVSSTGTVATSESGLRS